MKESRYYKGSGALDYYWCYATSELSEKGKELDARLQKCLDTLNAEIKFLKENFTKAEAYYPGVNDIVPIEQIAKNVGYKDMDIPSCLKGEVTEFKNFQGVTLSKSRISDVSESLDFHLRELSYLRDHIIKIKRYLRRGANLKSIDEFILNIIDILLGTDKTEENN